MYAAESNAPEGRDAQAPDLRGGCVYGPGPSRNAWAPGSAPHAGRPAARGTAGKNFLKKVLDTAERAR